MKKVIKTIAMAAVACTIMSILSPIRVKAAEEGVAEGLLHWSWVKVLNHNEEGSPMNWLFKQVKSLQPTEDVNNKKIEKPILDTPKVEKPKVEIDKDDAMEIKTGDKNTNNIVLVLLESVILSVIYLSKKKIISKSFD